MLVLISFDGHDAMQREAYDPRNRYTNTIFIGNDIIYNEWGARNTLGPLDAAPGCGW